MMKTKTKIPTTASASQKERKAYEKAKLQIAKSISDNQHLIDIQNETRTIPAETRTLKLSGIMVDATDRDLSGCPTLEGHCGITHVDKRTIPAEKPTGTPTWTDQARNAVRQGQSLNEFILHCHPNSRKEARRAYMRLIVASEKHAAQLAEALRDALKYADSATEHPENKAAFKRIVAKALAAYEESK